jgi:hypothetical protein
MKTNRVLARSLSITWIACMLALPIAARSEEPLRLREVFPAGYQYHVSCRVELAGNLILPAEKNQTATKSLPVTGSSAIEYDERVLAAGTGGQVEKTLRLYRRIDFRRKIGDRPQESTIRPAVRRLVLLRHKNQEVPFSPDGPLMWAEIDLVRTDVFTPALVGLLPDKDVKPGERWQAGKAAIQELTDMERIDEGEVECRFDDVTTFGKRRYARVGFRGSVRGVNEDGPNRQQLDGYLLFDLASNHIGYLSLKGISSLLDKDGKAQGTIEGQFVLTRQAPRNEPELADAALRALKLDPDADNTLLLYDSAELGIRFLYPRRWHVAGVHGQQVALDEAQGSGLLLTVEQAGRVPTGGQFLAESQEYLEKQKAKILRSKQPQRIQEAPREVENFALEAEVGGQRVVMDYYVSRQATRGVTLAARLLPGDLAGLQKEVQAIARSLQIEKPAPASK